PQLHSLRSTAGSVVEAAVIGLSEDEQNVILLVKKEIPLKLLSEQSRKTISLLTHEDAATREWANAPDFMRVPKSVEMSLAEYLRLPVAERISMVGTMLYMLITERVAADDFVKKVSEPHQLNMAAVQYEAFSTNIFKKMPPDTRFAIAFGAFLQSEGVMDVKSSSRESPATTNDSNVDTLDFADEQWIFVGTPSVHGDVSRSAMLAREFTGDTPGVRVIEFVGANPSTTLSEGVFKRILQRQVQRGSSWISDGRGERWLLDGTHEVCMYSNGEPDGLRKIWYENGQLKLTETHSNGKRTGTSTAYYDNGKVEWTATYVDDKEVSGEAFDRDGNPL
ncbi:MAG: hypothetical protein WBD31_20605, partial [Rubripirellula sp.]